LYSVELEFGLSLIGRVSSELSDRLVYLHPYEVTVPKGKEKGNERFKLVRIPAHYQP
jgi:hypothetical protein